MEQRRHPGSESYPEGPVLAYAEEHLAGYERASQVPGTYDQYADTREEIDWRARQPLLTPLRFLLVAGLAVGMALLVYGLFIDRSGLQIPILVSGFVLLGIVLVLMALSSVRRLLRLGREGRGGGALASALFGGLSAMGAAGCLAAALVIALLWGSA